MVDVLSTRARAVYTKWERGSDHDKPVENKLSFGSMKRHESIQRKRSSFISDNLQSRDLLRSKEAPWTNTPYRQSRPLMGGSCRACTPNSKEHIRASPYENRCVRNILKTDTETDDSFITRSFCHLVHNYRLKKFYYPQVSGTVLGHDRINNAIETTVQDIVASGPEENQSEERYRQLYTSQEARAKKILMDMRSKLSDVLLRITSWVLYKLLPRFLTSVCLHPSQLDMLKKAASTNLPLIFVPLHRSHLDYILITFILFNIDVQSPLVAAGNNLRIPVFGWLLRGLGAFFIKRRIDPGAGRKDLVYRAVLHTYMMKCLQAGHNIEFYIEGGRTRTGKPCMPKGGLLSVIIDAYMDGTVEDALLVPVSVNYDKLVDGNFIRELLGQPKKMESFSSAISAIWATINSDYGSMRIDFNQPFSLKELIKSFQAMNKLRRQSSSDLSAVAEPNLNSSRNRLPKEAMFRSIPSTTSLYGTDVVDEDHRVLVESIARHLVYDCAKACAVMSTNTLAFLLLNKFREGVKIDELVIAFDKLRQQLMADNRDVGFTGDSVDVINSAVSLLGPGLVKREKKANVGCDSSELCEVITPVTMLPNVIELSYYSNTLLPHFMVDGVVATSIATCIKSDASSMSDKIRITGDSIMRHSLEICDILQFEFIFSKPCDSLERVISESVDKFKTLEIISTEENLLLQEEKWCQKKYDSEEDDEFVQKTSCPTYIVCDRSEEVETLEFFHMLLRPLIDTYTVTAMCLHRLVDRQVTENDFVQEVMSEIKSFLDNGFCSYSESTSVEPIKNALKLFKKWGIVEMLSEGRVRLVYLTSEYNNEESSRQVYTRIAPYKFQNSVSL